VGLHASVGEDAGTADEYAEYAECEKEEEDVDCGGTSEASTAVLVPPIPIPLW
jgi:hypothetical protein